MDEQKAQMRFTFLLGAIAFASVVIAGILFAQQYTHPMPESDCSRPLDYPLCERADTPSPNPPPSITWVFLGTIGTAILAVLLLWIGYHASVIRQAEIVSSVAGSVKSTASAPSPAPAAAPASAPTTPTPPSSPSPANTKSTEVAASPSGKPASKSAPSSPPAIPYNTITSGMIAPPTAIPKKGVAASALSAAEKK